MRELLLVLLITVPPLCRINAQSHNGIKIIDKAQYFASYNYEYQQDSTSTSSKKQKEMWLFIGENISEFSHNSIYRMDSMFYECLDVKKQSNLVHIINQLKDDSFNFFTQYSIIKDKSSNKIDLYEVASSNYYHLPDNISFNWKITNKKDTVIAGYQCKEAQTSYRGRQYRAWYTMAIPISDGPYKFKGLPGLIIKLEDTHKEHCFELETFKKINYNKPIYLWDKKFIEIEAKQYRKLKHNEALDRSRMIGAQVQNISSEKLGSVEAKILRRNNLIEKY
nr:GLPGLI family protein [uncultured Carboxylicivirga sp.]